MIVPARAPVRPRVISPLTGESLLLEDEVRGLIGRFPRGAILLIGPAASGKTTALRHLASVFPDAPVRYLDGPDAGVEPARPDGWIIAADLPIGSDLAPAEKYRLAPWREDEWVEYLLATHKDRCGSVMARLLADDDRGRLEGNAWLSVIALEQFAASDTVTSVRSALLRHVADRCPDPENRLKAQGAALGLLLNPFLGPSLLAQLARPTAGSLLALLRHRPVQLLLAAAHVIGDLQAGRNCDYFDRPMPRDLVRELGAELAASAELRRVLVGWLWQRRERQAMAASVLHASGCPWTPPPGNGLRLRGAYLDRVDWREADLPGVDLRRADLSYADLRGSDLARAVLAEADLRQADLSGARLARVVAPKADLSRALLVGCNAEQGTFDEANLDQATLDRSELRGASFRGATLTGASFRAADLSRACLAEAELEGADFSGANFEGANLSGLKLRGATCAEARFPRADLSSSDLEDLELPAADFREANLQGALLTGSVMHAACFDGARLAQAGLAEVDWDGASLRGADLRGASFHLGTTRSGLVGSPIACEGSRTGFYTDDFTEQDFKSPEEIRKANLCRADLRGARIDGVDFYLVDLRHALLDPSQEKHVRRCGAILVTRGP